MTINPTWGQAFHYAFLTGYIVPLVAGIVLMAAALYVLINYWRINASSNGKSIFIFALLAGAFCLFFIKPAKIKFDNDKPLTAEQYEHYKGQTDVYFDSLYNDCRLLGAANNCK